MSFAIDRDYEKDLPEYDKISELTGVKYDYGYTKRKDDDDDRDDIKDFDDEDDIKEFDDKDDVFNGSDSSSNGGATQGDDDTSFEGTDKNDYIVSSGKQDKIESKAGDDAVLNQGGKKKVVETGDGNDIYAIDVSSIAKKGKTILKDFESGVDKVVVDGNAKVKGYGTNKLTITSGKKKHTIKSKEDDFDRDDVEFI
jgi:hypothetical protein